MEYMFSKAGKQLIVIDQYKFGFHKNLSGDIARWNNTKRGSTALVSFQWSDSGTGSWS